MPRSAENTIAGFVYQFHKTGISILEADNSDQITIEGLIEDIDIEPPQGITTAIQCKYHESVKKYTPSLIYKPLLQMAENDSKSKSKSIEYIIFIHTANCKEEKRLINKQEFTDALNSENSILKKIKSRITRHFDQDSFISRTYIEFGPSLLEIENMLKYKLKEIPIKNSNIDSVLYPNTIHLISKYSTKKCHTKRQTSREEFIKKLSEINETAITSWTLSLREYSNILRSKRSQLQSYLQQNCRERYFLINPSQLEKFNEEIVVFIQNFLRKYHYKILHTKTPLFAIDLPISEIQEIEERLFKKGIRSNTGIIGKKFNQDEFFREPIINVHKNSIEKREFDIRLLSFTDHKKALNHKKGDDFYMIAEDIIPDIDVTDMMSVVLGISNFNELSYIMNMQNSYD